MGDYPEQPPEEGHLTGHEIVPDFVDEVEVVEGVIVNSTEDALWSIEDICPRHNGERDGHYQMFLEAALLPHKERTSKLLAERFGVRPDTVRRIRSVWGWNERFHNLEIARHRANAVITDRALRDAAVSLSETLDRLAEFAAEAVTQLDTSNLNVNQVAYLVSVIDRALSGRSAVADELPETAAAEAASAQHDERPAKLLKALAGDPELLARVHEATS